MNHDKMCPQAYQTRDDYERVQVDDDGCQMDWDCRCNLITRVRTDERTSTIHDAVQAVMDAIGPTAQGIPFDITVLGRVITAIETLGGK